VGTLKVHDWAKWTRAKKKTIVVFYTIGLLLGFTIENASIWWGVLGLIFCAIGAIIMSTIRVNEW
jgi:hypothetical protein